MDEPVTRVERNSDVIWIVKNVTAIGLTIEQTKYLQRQLESILGVPAEAETK